MSVIGEIKKIKYAIQNKMNTGSSFKSEIAIKIILFCTLMYFPIFLHLGMLPIRI